MIETEQDLQTILGCQNFPLSFKSLKNFSEKSIHPQQLFIWILWKLAKLKSKWIKNITHLDLSDHNLTHLPECIREFSCLKTLDLSRNLLQEIPESLGELTQLTTLYLHNNKLEKLPSSLDQLTNLIDLNTIHNSLEVYLNNSKAPNNLKYYYHHSVSPKSSWYIPYNNTISIKTIKGVEFSLVRCPTIKPINLFWIGETPVTQQLWTIIMENNPSCFSNHHQSPVDSIKLSDCYLFLNKLSELDGLEKVYLISNNQNSSVEKNPSANGYRLPEQWEWKHASNANTYYSAKYSDRFIKYPLANDFNDAHWDLKGLKDSTCPVKQRNPNSWRIYDMKGNTWEYGNIWEYCQDIDDSDQIYYKYGGDGLDFEDFVAMVPYGAEMDQLLIPLDFVGFRICCYDSPTHSFG